MINMAEFEAIDPYVRMMRVKKAVSLSGKWRDIDNVFTYVAAGDAEFVMNGNRYQLHTGNAILIPSYMAHMIVSNSTEQLVQYIIHFDFFETEESRKLVHKDVMDETENQRVISGREAMLGSRIIIAEIPETERNMLIRMYLNMHREFEQDLPGRNLMLKAGCMQILTLLMRNSVDVSELGQKDGMRTKSWIHIENAIDYIQRMDMRSGLDNDSIAAAIGVSPNYLTKVFQRQLGIPLHKYIMNLRVERAQQLLLSGTQNVTEVANQMGFSSIHAFSKAFKNMLGISPSQFLDEVVNREYIAENMNEPLE